MGVTVVWKDVAMIKNKVECLPFRVRWVRDEQELRRAVSVRHAAYARHVPEFAQTLAQPEPIDYDDDVVVLLAESKVDGAPLGTMRIQTNTDQPLDLEQSLTLPPWLQGARLAEATRLGLSSSLNTERESRLVKGLLFKAFYRYCLLHQIDWMVVAGRSPMDRQYERLLFQDVYPGLGYIPLRHAFNLPHRVMALHVPSAETRWSAAKHPLLRFMCHTEHPDIPVVGTSVIAFDAQGLATPGLR
jgi:hypothetical protein